MKGQRSSIGSRKAHFCEVCGVQSFGWNAVTKVANIDENNRCPDHRTNPPVVPPIAK